MSDSVQKYSASRMGSAPIGPLLLSCSVPMMISMLVQALYNIVDSLFVAQINEKAKQLLRNSDFTVSEIAQRTGFCDASYLTRVFRRHEQMTPRRYAELDRERNS